MKVDAEFWNRIAEKYARKPVDRPEAFERKISITKSHMTSTDVVLDAGCGTGSLALRLAETGADVHGLDVSSEMIRIARGKAEAQSVDNVTFHVGPFDESFTFFPARSLSGLCAYSLLHLVEDRPATLRLIHRLLEPGGFFISSTLCLRDSWIPYAPLLLVLRGLKQAPPVWCITRKTLEHEIRDAGFVDLSAPDVGAESTVAFLVARTPH